MCSRTVGVSTRRVNALLKMNVDNDMLNNVPISKQSTELT